MRKISLLFALLTTVLILNSIVLFGPFYSSSEKEETYPAPSINTFSVVHLKTIDPLVDISQSSSEELFSAGISSAELNAVFFEDSEEKEDENNKDNEDYKDDVNEGDKGKDKDEEKNNTDADNSQGLKNHNESNIQNNHTNNTQGGAVSAGIPMNIYDSEERPIPFYSNPISKIIEKIEPDIMDIISSIEDGTYMPGEEMISVLVRLDNMNNAMIIEERGFTVTKQFDFINTAAVNVPRQYFTEDLFTIADIDDVSGVYVVSEIPLAIQDSVSLINADVLWAMQDPFGSEVTGKNITIAIFDTGIQYNHSAFGCTQAQIMEGTCPKIIDSWNFRKNLPPETDPRYACHAGREWSRDVFDCNGHGTHVAGIAASMGGINPEMKGVAYDAKLAIFKVCGDYGCTNTDILAAVEHAIDPNGDGDTSDRYDIFSLSLGSTGMSPDHPLSLALDAAYEAGAIVFASAGNRGWDYEKNVEINDTILCPACAKNVIAVGASTKSDLVWDDSSRGYYSYENYAFAKPNIIAPGANINSTTYNGGYGTKSGTSMASPMMAGSAALLMQLNPGWDNRILKSALTTIADDLGYSMRAQGAGRVNLEKSANIKAWFAPVAAEFGAFNDVMIHYYNESIVINITSLSSSAVEYDVFVIRDIPFDDFAANYHVSTDKNSFTLNPYSTEYLIFNVYLDFNNTNSGLHPGYILINSSNETYKIPWLFKKEGDYLNHPPVANAGYNLFVYNGSTVQLNGTKSYDADGDELTYSWSRLMGTPYTLDDPNSATPTYTTNPEDIGSSPFFNGLYTVWRLFVSDGKTITDDYVDVRVSKWDFYSEHDKLWYDGFSREERIDYRDNEGYVSGTMTYSVLSTLIKMGFRQQFLSDKDAQSIRLCSYTTYMDIWRDTLQNFTICRKDTGANCLPNTMSKEIEVHGAPEFIDRCTPFFDYELSKGDHYLISTSFFNLTDMMYTRMYMHSWEITDYFYTFTLGSISDELPVDAVPDTSRRQIRFSVYEGIGTDAEKIQLYSAGNLVHLNFPSRYSVTFQNLDGAEVDENGFWQTDINTETRDYTVRVTVSDGVRTPEYKDVVVRIYDTDSVPEIEQIADQKIDQGQMLTIEVNATDKFSPLYYYINDTKFSQPGGINSNVFTWTPSYSDAGNYSFMINVSNGVNQDFVIFNVEVIDVPALPNNPPVITDITVSNTWETEKVTIQIDAYDEEGDDLFYSTTNPNFMQVSDNVFEWQTAEGDAGDYSIIIGVTDLIDTTQAFKNFTVNNKYTLRIATAKYYEFYYNKNPTAWINPSTITVVSGTKQTKTANPAANFIVRSNERITYTNAASGYYPDTDYIFFDNQLALCSGAACSYTTSGYSTTCTRKTDLLYYDCVVKNKPQLETDMGFLWSPSEKTAWNINYLLTK